MAFSGASSSRHRFAHAIFRRLARRTNASDSIRNHPWLVDRKLAQENTVCSFVKTLASSLTGTEEEAKKTVCSSSTTNSDTRFGALMSEELSLKVKGDLFFDGNPRKKIYPRNSRLLSLWCPLRLFQTRHIITYRGPETSSDEETVNSTPTEEDGEEECSVPPKWVSPEYLEDGNVMIEGCDFEHWLVIMGFPAGQRVSKDEMVRAYVSTVAQVLGSEEEAKEKIYSVSTTLYTGFGVAVSREIALKFKGLPNVHWVLPDSYIDVPSKDYGGDLYENGKITPRPKYHVPSPRAESDTLDSHIYEIDHETEQVEEEREKAYEQLRSTMEAVKKDVATSAPASESETASSEVNDLFLRLRKKMESSSSEISKTEKESEADKKKSDPAELRISSRTKEKMAVYLSKSKDSPDRPKNPARQGVADLSHMKEAMKVFKMKSEPLKDEGSSSTVETGSKGAILQTEKKDCSAETRDGVSSLRNHPIFDTLKGPDDQVVGESSDDRGDPKKRSSIEIYSFDGEEDQRSRSVDDNSTKDDPKAN